MALQGLRKTGVAAGPLRVEQEVIDAARGVLPADTLLKNVRLVNVHTGAITRTNVAVKSGRVAGFGDCYSEGRETLEMGGEYLLPGFIDAHIHIESTLLTPEGYSEVAAIHGTTTAVSDPHEIVNVKGMTGFKYMVDAAAGLPVDILYTVPSCVPATDMETSGAHFGVREIEEAFRRYPQSPALSEMMNYPGVVDKDPRILRKLKAAHDRGKLLDGHCPGLTGNELNAYISAGISSDHECTRADEASEKAGKGLRVFVREGSTEKNLAAIIPAVSRKNSRSFCLVSDDRHVSDLMGEGELDHILSRAVRAGLDKVTAVRMATINPAMHYNLRGKGAIAPGFRADLAVVEDLVSFKVRDVYKDGRAVVRDGRLLERPSRISAGRVRESVRIPPGLSRRIRTPAAPEGRRVRIIKVLPDQITTKKISASPDDIGVEKDILKAVVVERHRRTGNVGVGFIRGFGLKKGAIASTFAHDSHNLVAVGTNDADIVFAANRLARLEGGMVVAAGGRVLAEMPLPVAGLMSEKAPEEAAREHAALRRAAAELGCALKSPFMTLSFIALPVVPELRLTDKGLVDVGSFSIVESWE